MLRFHSFYPWHKHGAYDYLCNGKDRSMLEWVLKFNQYDLYSKGHSEPAMAEQKPYYDDLLAEFLPPTLAWQTSFVTTMAPLVFMVGICFSPEDHRLPPKEDLAPC